MSVDVIAFATATAAGLALYLAVRYARTEGSLWLAAWPVMMGTASLILFQAQVPGVIYVEHLLGPWFPALQAAGSMQFVGRTRPRWLVPGTVAIGIARAGLVAGEWHAVRFPLALAWDTLAYGLATLALWRAARGPVPWWRHALWMGTAGLLVLNALNYWHDMHGLGVSTPFWTAWAFVGFANFGLQVGAVAHRAAARAEAALREERARAAATVAGGVAHDFNNLLAIIAGNAELARLQLSTGPKGPVAEALDEVGGAVARGAAITQRLREHLGDIPVRIEGVAASQLVRRALERAQAREHARVTWSPAHTSAGVAYTDPLLVQTVLDILIENALEESSTSTVRIGAREVELRDARDGEGATRVDAGRFVVLEVQDDGPGIPDSIRARVFEPFVSTRALGRGLGLPAVAGLMRALGGLVELSSAPGRGTTVRLYLGTMPPLAAEPTWPQHPSRLPGRALH